MDVTYAYDDLYHVKVQQVRPKGTTRLPPRDITSHQVARHKGNKANEDYSRSGGRPIMVALVVLGGFGRTLESAFDDNLTL